MLLKKQMTFIFLVVLFSLTANLYPQKLIQASIYYKASSRNAIVDVNSIMIKPDSSSAKITTLPFETQTFITNKINEASKNIEDGNYFKAILTCDTIEETYSEYYAIYFIRATAYQMQGDFSLAVRDYERALSYFPRNEYLYQRTALFYETIGQYEEAIKVYITAFKVFSSYGWLYKAGTAALYLKDIQSANYYFMYGMRSKSPGYSYEGLADLEVNIGNYAIALDGYKYALKLYENIDKSDIGSIVAEQNTERIKKAIESTEIQIEIESWKTRFVLRDFQNAFVILQRLSGYTSKYPELMLYAAKTHFEIGQYKEAANILKYVTNIAPQLEEAYILLAQISVFNNDYYTAVRILESGFKGAYYKIELYEALINVLYDKDSIYYANKVVDQVGNYFNLSPENKARYARYLVYNKEYSKAENVIKTLPRATDNSAEILNTIEYQRILDKAAELYEKKYYVDMMRLLSLYAFTGVEEEIRIRYLANAYNLLGSLDKAIEVLMQKFNDNNIGINNANFLKYLLGVRRSGSTSQIQRDDDLISIKAITFWEDDLKDSPAPVVTRIDEYIAFKQFQEALNYINELRKRNFSAQFIKDMETKVYSYYALELYRVGNIDLARNISDLAVRRNKENFDVIAINREIEISILLNSLGDYNDSDAYVVLTPVIQRIVNIAPAYFDNRLLLAKSYAKEYRIEGYTIGINMRRYANIIGMGEYILSTIYTEGKLYRFAENELSKSQKYSNNSLVLTAYANNAIKMGAYNMALESIDKLLKINPRDANALYMLSIADSLKNSKATQIAVDAIDKAISIDPNNLNYMYQLGKIQELSGSTESALATFSSIALRYRNYAMANYNTAYLLLTYSKDPDKALSYAAVYNALTPQDPSGYKLLGDIYMIQADKLDGQNASRLINLAISNYKQGLSKCIWAKDINMRKTLDELVKSISLRLSEGMKEIKQ